MKLEQKGLNFGKQAVDRLMTEKDRKSDNQELPTSFAGFGHMTALTEICISEFWSNIGLYSGKFQKTEYRLI